MAPASISSIHGVSDLDPMARVDLVRHGVPASFVQQLSDELRMDRSALYKTLGMARSTTERKLRENKRLSSADSERIVGLARLVGQVARLLEQSGNPSADTVDAAQWTASWLERPNNALGGLRPAELMDNAEGRALVADVIARAESGAYA